MAQREAQNGLSMNTYLPILMIKTRRFTGKYALKTIIQVINGYVFSQGQRGFVTKEPDFNAMYPVDRAKAIVCIGTDQPSRKRCGNMAI
jgi:hypothetical protein